MLQQLVDDGLLGGVSYAEILGDLADLDLLGFTDYADVLTELLAQGLLATTTYARILGDLADLNLLGFTDYATILTELVAQGLLATATYAQILGDLADLDLLDAIGYGDILADLVEQGLLGTETLAEIYAELLGPPSVLDELSMADVFDGLVAEEDLSWQELDLGLADLQSLDTSGGKVVYTAQFTVTDGSGAEDVDVTITLPNGFVLDPGDRPTLDIAPGGSPAVSEPDSVAGQMLTWNLSGIPNGVTTLRVPALAGLRLGPTTASASVAAAGLGRMPPNRTSRYRRRSNPTTPSTTPT